MIYSMTAYDSQHLTGIWGNAIWEIRTLNQRYLEIYIRIPEELRTLEYNIRQYIRKKFSRGKIECYLKFNLNNKENHFFIDNMLINNILKIYKEIQSKNYKININFFDLLKWPGIFEIKQDNLEMLKNEIFNAFKKVVKKIIEIRINEGMVLKKLIQKRLFLIQIEIEKIRIKVPHIAKLYKKKLILKLKEFDVNIDDFRLAQEILFIIQKSDITEELDRIELHIKETLKILNCLKPMGRRLDFMMQELNREINTIASKSNNFHITDSTIEIKVLIEQMREQIQNIE